LRIQIEPHTLERAAERGVNASQIEDVVRTGNEVPAGAGRLAKAKVYDYDGVWKGRYYDQQMVKVVYVIERDVVITVTVVAHYGRWPEER